MYIQGTIKNYPARSLQQIILFKDGFKTGCYCTTEFLTSRIHIPYRNINYCHLHNPKRNKKNTVKKEINISSLRRSKSKILDYALADTFDYFVTFTIDPSKLDPLDHDLTKKHLSIWLRSLRYKSPDLKYVIVPELHKSGAIHFHGLFKNLNQTLTPSLTKTGRKRFDKSKRQVFNLPAYKFGFSTAVKMDKSPAAAYYITKYIKKEMLQNSVLNKKRYWVSKNLNKGINYTFKTKEEIQSYTRNNLSLLSTFRSEYYTKYTRSTVFDYIDLTAIEKPRKVRYSKRAKLNEMNGVH